MESIFDILYIPMGFLIRLAYNLTNNYMLAICLFALVMEIILCPIAIKQQKNQVKQASLAPKVAAINKKYAGRTDQVTKQKQQEELMKMYQDENYNPAGGCMPMLIQLPIIMCLYSVIIHPLRYISNIPTAQINALTEFLTNQGVVLSQQNQQIEIINHLREVGVADYLTVAPALENAVLPVFRVGPFDLSQVPEISFNPFNWLMLIPVITFVVMILSQKITQKFTYQSPETKDAQNAMSMKIMMWTMPLMSVYIEFQLAAAIGIYWIFRQILATVERIILYKVFPTPKFSEADYKEAERIAAMSNKQKKREKKQVRSLHHIDDEEYLARHAADNAEDEAEEQAEEKSDKAQIIDKAPMKDEDKK